MDGGYVLDSRRQRSDIE